MIRYVLGSRASIGGVLGSGRGGAAAAWYLAGGVSAANCIAAYTPKSAASLAASYDNNAAPGNGLADGTYDAAPGVAPTFDTATGWTFNGSTQYLKTGVTPTLHTWSMLIRFSGFGGTVNSGHMIGVNNGTGKRWLFVPYSYTVGGTYVDIYFGGFFSVKNGGYTSGVIGSAGSVAYYGGSSIGAIPTGTAGTLPEIYIGASNYVAGGVAGSFSAATIQAVAIYNVTLDAATIAAISAAMAAL